MNFDKFIDDTILKEKASRKSNKPKSETPQREFAKKYREKPANRTYYGKK